MKNTTLICLLSAFYLFFSSCESVTNKQKLADAEARAKAVEARLDSIANAEKIAEINKAKAEADLKAGKMPSVSVSEVGKLNPVDEGQLDKGFDDFRALLLGAIKRKDVRFIRSILSEEVKFSFTEAGGKEGFEKTWELDKNSTRSELWQELGKVLKLGGTFENSDRNIFTAPYVATSFTNGYDITEYAAVTGQGVRMREEASRNGRNLANLSYDIVRLLPDENPRRERIGRERHYWRKVQMEDGLEGYIYGQFLHSPIDYRATFGLEDEEWKLLMFITGTEDEMPAETEE